MKITVQHYSESKINKAHYLAAVSECRKQIVPQTHLIKLVSGLILTVPEYRYLALRSEGKCELIKKLA